AECRNQLIHNWLQTRSKRNGSEVRGRKSEITSQRSEVGGQRSVGRSQRRSLVHHEHLAVNLAPSQVDQTPQQKSHRMGHRNTMSHRPHSELRFASSLQESYRPSKAWSLPSSCPSNRLSAHRD